MQTHDVGILVAALGGLAVGIERQWSGHASGPRAHFAGVRTFTLIGGCGGICGWLWVQNLPALAAILAAAAVAMTVAGYLAASRVDTDATTEVAALVVIAAGIVAGLGHFALSSAIVAVTGLVLIEKTRLHALVGRLDDEPLRAAARFGVMAVVILPLLPEGPYGPGLGVRPRELWVLVLLFSAISFAGYLSRRAVGARLGYPLAGLLGGLISSTNVTLAFARASRASAHGRLGLAYGVVAACTTLYARVAMATSALNLDLARTLWGFLVPPFIAGVIALLVGLRHVHRETHVPEPPRNPLQFVEAIQMAALFQVVLFGVDLVERLAGNVGVVASGAVLGLTDMDALTMSMARAASGSVSLDVAARAIAVGLVSNTLLKMGIALTFGAPRFRGVVAVSLAAMAVSVVAALYA